MMKFAYLLVGVMLCVIGTARYGFANDAFYYNSGAGSTVIPIENGHLRVISEDLQIVPINKPPRYCVYPPPIAAFGFLRNFIGKSVGFFRRYIPGDDAANWIDLTDNDVDPYPFGFLFFGPTGEAIPFLFNGSQPQNYPGHCWIGFTPEWHAEVVYKIIANEDQRDVLMGFPVQPGHLNEVGGEIENLFISSSVVNFRTFIDEQEIPSPTLHWVKDTPPLAYLWRATFIGGHTYTLKTTYDFGTRNATWLTSYVSDEEDVINSGWWLRARNEELRRRALRENKDISRDQDSSHDYAVEKSSFKYYLTPLKRWASPPPDRISVQVRLPFSSLYTKNLGVAPTCIDDHTLYYELRNELPQNDLEVEYGDYMEYTIKDFEKKVEVPMRKTTYWRQWQQDNGGPRVRLTCQFINTVARTAGPVLKKKLRRVPCVSSCSSVSFPVK